MVLISPVFAFSYDDMPASLYIKESPQYIGCAEIESDHQVIGSLYRLGAKENKRGLTFEYTDENKQKQTTLKFKQQLGDDVLFYLYDINNKLVGRYYHLFSQDPVNDYTLPVGFQLYSADGITLLMTGWFNGWTTHLTIYAKKNAGVIMELSRPFFSWSRTWETTMINTSLLSKSDVDPNIFATILAFNSIGQWQPLFESSMLNSISTKSNEAASLNPDIQSLIEKLDRISQSQGLSYQNAVFSNDVLKTAVSVFNSRYAQRYDDTYLNDEDRINQFIDFSIELICSNEISTEQKNAMLQFMMRRLKKGNNRFM